MFACIAPVFFPGMEGRFVRTSWYETMTDAAAATERYLGVIAVEEIGVGIVWHVIGRAEDYARHLNKLNDR